jgi:hypothetical protein
VGKNNEEQIELRIAEIERLIREFNIKLDKGLSDSEHFMTMSEIEQLWGKLKDGTNNMYSEMIQERLKLVDERDLVRKKKENTETKE